MKVTIIFTGTDNPAKQNQRIEVAEGCTVRAALAQAGVPTENVSVNVDRVKGSLDDKLGANSSVTVTMTNLKGAAQAVISFEEILAFGTKPPVVTGNAVDQAMAEVAEEASKVHKTIVKGLLGTMKDEAARVNANLAKAEKALEDAKEEVAELLYATEQLKKNNIFSLIGFAGMKGYASTYCSQMGCEVPPSDSPLWATSAPKCKKANR